ncbi:MAG: T9SS type A sorting domain-containing protein [Bacteroidales bacterium]|nr:T9SS type A sorting domain-containing protein [Bacteroidales bacterium]
MINKVISLCIIILVISVQDVTSQNLVYNGSFEIRDSIYDPYSVAGWYSCPFSIDDKDLPMLKLAKGWYNIQGKYMNQWYSTFDYYHSCNNYIDSFPSIVTPGIVGVPKNKWVTMYQYPRTGEGYTAGGFYVPHPNYTINPGDLIQNKLLNSLQKDSLYLLNFYVNLANGSKYSINSQGALLSFDSINITDLYEALLDSSIVPQILNKKGFIEDTLGWVKISGVFKSNGNEQYITLGNMDISKGKEKLFNQYATFNYSAYAIDDISLFLLSAPIDSARCGNDTIICLGNSLKLGKSHVKPEYKEEYSFEWTILGLDDSVFSYEEHPVVYPDTTTTYIVKVIDFKFDKTIDSITVKVVDCTKPTNLFVYPNPSYGKVNFRFNSPISERMSIEIYDIAGRLLNQKSFDQNYESNEVQMNINTFAVGMYFYSVIIDGERKFNGKLIRIK